MNRSTNRFLNRGRFAFGLGWLVLAFASLPVMAQQPRYQDRQVTVPGIRAISKSASVPKLNPNDRVTTPAKSASVKSAPAKSASGKSQASLLRRAAHDELSDEMPPKLVKRPKSVPRTSATATMVQQASFGCSCGECIGEPTCGYEVGCGAESCSVSGCDGGCAPSCGSEGYEASCGLETLGAGGCDACGVSSCDGACGVMCGTDSYNFCLPILRMEWQRFEFFAGVNGFTGPANYANTAAPAANSPASYRIGSSSFGFYEGLNEGRNLKPLFGIDLASQLGVRATQSSLSGTEFTDDTRNQVFVTGGFFRRVDFGLQYGVVVDYLNDDWWFSSDLLQMRGELSWNDGCSHEFGYQFMAGLEDSTSGTNVIASNGTRFRSTVTFEPTDQHRFFFRGATAGGGNYFAFVGGTDRSDGLLGGGMTSPVRRGFAFQAGTAYLIPNEGRRNGGNENESWNLSLGIIYRPGGRKGCGQYCRPMFDVADNGTFMIDRL